MRSQHKASPPSPSNKQLLVHTAARLHGWRDIFGVLRGWYGVTVCIREGQAVLLLAQTRVAVWLECVSCCTVCCVFHVW